MKFQIDTKEKTIKVDGFTNLFKLVKCLKKMLPDWKEYDIKSDSTWNYYPYYPVTYPSPSYPWYTWDTISGSFTLTGDSNTVTLGSGDLTDTTTSTVYNVCVQ